MENNLRFFMNYNSLHVGKLVVWKLPNKPHHWANFKKFWMQKQQSSSIVINKFKKQVWACAPTLVDPHGKDLTVLLVRLEFDSSQQSLISM